MKKLLYCAAALAAVFFAGSCQRENLEPVANGNTVTYTVQVPGDIATKSDNASSKLIYEVYRIAEDQNETRLYQKSKTFTGNTVEVDLELVNNQNFRVLFWAQANETSIYKTESLKNVTIDHQNLIANTDAYAAFAGYDVIKSGQNLVGRRVDLVRPVAQLNIGTSQESLILGEGANNNTATTVTVATSSVKVNGLSTSYNVATETAGQVSAADFVYESYSVEGLETLTVNSEDYQHISMNYLGFAAPTGSTVTVSYTIETNVGTISNKIDNVPVKANYRTNIVGNLITSTSDYTVSLDYSWPTLENNVEVVSVSTAQDLQDVIDEASTDGIETNIKLDGDINLADLFATRTTSTSEPQTLTIPAAKTISIDLNGYSLSAIDDTEKNYSVIDNRGTLTISNSATSTSKISVKAEINSGWNRYSAVLANNPGGKLTVEEGVVLEHLGGTDMAYGIDNLTNGKGTYAVTVIDGATVKSPYRAVRQFLNGAEATNELHVKAGSVLEGANKSIFFHDPSTGANTGKLVVEAGAQLKGDVYLFVTAGSSEWPVDVTIAASALVDGSEVVTGNVPDGYNVTTVNGNWIVEKDYEWTDDETCVIYTASGLKWVAEQVNTMEYYVNQSANIFDGKTVYLAADIDFGGAEWTPIGDYAFSRTSFNGTFDGQNYTVSNFKVTKPVKWTEKVTEASYGFFGNVKGTIKNLTVNKATVNPEGGRYSAVLVGRLHNGGSIENCHVANSSATINHWQVGGIVGQNNNGNITDCSVVKSTITGKAAVGAIVGMDMVAGEHKIENCVVKETALVQNESFGADYDASYGLAVGLVNSSGIILNLKNITIENNQIKGIEADTLVGDIVTGAIVKIDGATSVSTAAQLDQAIKEGGNYFMLNDIAITAGTYQNVNFSLDGNGYTISQVEGSDNPYGLFDSVTGKFTLKNVTFDGIKDGAVLRTTGAELTLDNVTVKNCEHTQIYGLFRLIGKNVIKNCKFENNNCTTVITFNTEGDGNTDPQLVQNCEFKNNTCSATAVVHYSTGGSATIDGNKFLNNTLQASNGATLYMGFKKNCTVTNNLFDGNTVTATSKRSSGGLMIGNAAVVTGNAFVNNTVTVNGETGYGNDVCASPYYAAIDLSGNYWGGGAPVEGDDYYKEYNNYEVIINDYLTENPIK